MIEKTNKKREIENNDTCKIMILLKLGVIVL